MEILNGEAVMSGLSNDAIPVHRIRQLGWFLGFLLLVGAVFIESLFAPTIDNSLIPNLDKMVHFAVFGLLAFLLLRSLRAFGFTGNWRIFLGVILTITLLGVLDEWVQSGTPGRTASTMDVLADVTGRAWSDQAKLLK